MIKPRMCTWSRDGGSRDFKTHVRIEYPAGRTYDCAVDSATRDYGGALGGAAQARGGATSEDGAGAAIAGGGGNRAAHSGH